ncbi:MAG: polysaccharide deacetylase family protein [Bacteroidales bacterium]|nr:polysaccharide deacetylase family protein [Bacteroidales bacterium]
MKILSFDIEEWFIEKRFKNDESWKYVEFDYMLNRILELLDEHSTKATFFCLGELAREFPDVVRKIAEKGHEIGCHSNSHRWINKMSPEEFRKDTVIAIESLEQLIGEKIRSYRAPAFSIGESNKWAFEILAEAGIENDASIFPGTRDFGGFPAFEGGGHPCTIEYNGIHINEFPISLTKLPFIGKSMAYSGGGYFRLLPLNFVKTRMKYADYVMCYFHIADLLDFKSKFMTKKEFERYFKTSGNLKNRTMRYVKSNIGRKRAFKGLTDLVKDFKFCTVEQATGSNTLPLIKI